jgi:hypothetical protein
LHLRDKATRERDRTLQLDVVHFLPQNAESGYRRKGDPVG